MTGGNATPTLTTGVVNHATAVNATARQTRETDAATINVATVKMMMMTATQPTLPAPSSHAERRTNTLHSPLPMLPTPCGQNKWKNV